MRSLRRLGGIVGVGIFLWILSQQDLTTLGQMLAHFHWRFGLILLFYGVIFGLDTLGWSFALNGPSRSRVRWDDLLRARLVGEAVNYVTPMAWIGGEPIKALLLARRHGVPLADGMASVVVAKTTFTLAMLLFILTGLAVAMATEPIPPPLAGWVGIIFPVLCGLLALFLTVQFIRPFSRGLKFFERFFPRGWARAGQRLEEWDEAITKFYRGSPKALFWSIAFAFLGWMAGVVEVYLILTFLGIPVSWATAWTIESLWVLLRSGAFLIPAGLGANEGFAIVICATLGINAVTALALGLIRRARELTWVGLGLVEFSRE